MIEAGSDLQNERQVFEQAESPVKTNMRTVCASERQP
jgi:hypothetical protein